MILLDTDHLTVLQIPESARRDRLVARLALADEPVGTTIVNVEEQMRGWMASIAKERQPHRQIRSYSRLADLFDFFSDFELARFDDAAANVLAGRVGGRCHGLSLGRGGSMDMLELTPPARAVLIGKLWALVRSESAGEAGFVGGSPGMDGW